MPLADRLYYNCGKIRFKFVVCYASNYLHFETHKIIPYLKIRINLILVLNIAFGYNSYVNGLYEQLFSNKWFSICQNVQ